MSRPGPAGSKDTEGFRGFPGAAVTFFEGLEEDNSKAYWLANKAVYDTSARTPMEAFIASVDKRFQPLKIFRPNRDLRFSKDKSPYKTAIGAVGEGEGGTMYYVQLSAQGLMAASGYWHLAADQLARYREAVADATTGAEVAAITDALVRAGYTLGAADALKTSPRGYPKDHPRIELLRRKGLTAGKQWPVQRWLHTAKAKDRVEAAWAGAGPLNAWLDRHVGPSELPPYDREFR